MNSKMTFFTLPFFSYLPKWLIHHHYGNLREELCDATVNYNTKIYFNTTRVSNTNM